MRTTQEIHKIHAAFWERGYGSISAKEALFLQKGIVKDKPKEFLEIGTASGLSTGFIALFMHDNEGLELTTLDLDSTFWMDRTQPTGFLAERIYPHQNIKVNYLREKTALYIEKGLRHKTFDMAFVDANHQHPWPTLDMICLLPFMAKGSSVYHHDLALYKLQKPVVGVGPKYLYDQVPEALKEITDAPEGNIFLIKTPDDYRTMQEFIIDSLYLPWTIRNKIDSGVVDSIVAIAHKCWGKELVDAIRLTANKFN